VYLMV